MMCEVRAAAAHQAVQAAGTMWRMERSGFRHIERVFLYAGQRMTNLHTDNHLEQKFSPQLLKNWKQRNFLWLKITNNSTAEIHPCLQKYNVELNLR